jgi:hypothetical protein
LENPPNPLFKGEIANLWRALIILRELSRIKLSNHQDTEEPGWGKHFEA